MKTTEALFGILTITTALAMQVQAQTFLTNGLVAYYPFNGNANDASGNGVDGVVHGATLTADRLGLTGSAYRFNGSGWIQLPDAILPLAASEFTLSLWVLADGGPYTTTEVLTELTPRRGTCSLGAGTGHWGFSVKLQDSGWQPNYPPVPMITNMWAQLVGIYKQGQYVKFYVNRSLEYSNAIPDEILETNATSPLNSAIGIYDYAPVPYQGFNGAIDDVRIYNRALSASEVQQLYVYESGPEVDLIKAVKPSFRKLTLTTNYQLQLSADMKTWTNQGSAFTATNTSMVYPQYWDVDNWNSLFFRLQVAP